MRKVLLVFLFLYCVLCTDYLNTFKERAKKMYDKIVENKQVINKYNEAKELYTHLMNKGIDMKNKVILPKIKELKERIENRNKTAKENKEEIKEEPEIKQEPAEETKEEETFTKEEEAEYGEKIRKLLQEYLDAMGKEGHEDIVEASGDKTLEDSKEIPKDIPKDL
ncbi:hypothetical protein NEOKW01_0025 [Nematocida sp. AWRm80]|nr:hypothetical protein NEOKW01_0025 [Nematocida sp. AWRm80]